MVDLFLQIKEKLVCLLFYGFRLLSRLFLLVSLSCLLQPCLPLKGVWINYNAMSLRAARMGGLFLPSADAQTIVCESTRETRTNNLWQANFYITATHEL